MLRRCVYLIHVLTLLFKSIICLTKRYACLLYTIITDMLSSFVRLLLLLFLLFLSFVRCVSASCNTQTSYFRYHSDCYFLRERDRDSERKRVVSQNRKQKKTGTNKMHTFSNQVSIRKQKRKFESGRFERALSHTLSLHSIHLNGMFDLK